MSKYPIAAYFENAVRLQTLIHTGEDIRAPKRKRRRPKMCEECGVNPGDPRICPGCDAYREHTGHF